MKRRTSGLDIERFPEFNQHRLVTFLHDDSAKLKGFIAIHRCGERIPSLGATRLWKYPTPEDALRDALRLSRMMSYKSAFARLPYGGAKAALMHPLKNSFDRTLFFKTYAARVNYLGGRFITGTDVGLTLRDLNVMRKESNYMIGAKSNPEKFTALGLFYAIQVCLKELFGNEVIAGKTFAIKGLGKVGFGLLKLLYREGAVIVASDINARLAKEIQKSYPHIRLVRSSEIHRENVDVYSPCALGNALTPHVVSELDCKIIVGGANNQLETLQAGDDIHKRGILYAPDYAVNAGGLISVVDEFERASHDPKRVTQRVKKIRKRLRAILTESKKKHMPAHRIADQMAEQIIATYQ